MEISSALTVIGLLPGAMPAVLQLSPFSDEHHVTLGNRWHGTFSELRGYLEDNTFAEIDSEELALFMSLCSARISLLKANPWSIR